MQRRHLLKLSAALPLGSSALAAADRNAPDVTVREVKDDIAAPVLNRGDLVLVDTAVTRFQGEALYLYPAWGEPRAYQLSRRGDRLLFSVPGSSTVLWQQDMHAEASGLAGMVIAFSQPHELEKAGLRWVALQVPRLPVTG